VGYADVASVMEVAAFGGFGMPALDGTALVLHVLPVGAKGMQASLMDEVATTPGAPAPDDSEAAFGEVRRPAQIVLLRIEAEQVEAVWADQLADEPIAKRIVGDAGKLDAFGALLAQACRVPTLACDRLLVEAEPAAAFDRVSKVVMAFARARSRTTPIKTEFVALDAASTASERAAARVGVSLESGQLPKDAVERVIRANYGRINDCYAAGLKTDPTLRGRLVVRLVIDARGAPRDVANAREPQELRGDPALRTSSASGASKKPATLTNPAVASCILDVFRSLEFPAPKGGSVKILYPLSLAPN
jgi:hypothetical protein